MKFEDTPEYQRSVAMRPACNRVLCRHWGVTPDMIERFNSASDLFILDKEFAIDMRVKLPNGSHVTGQEKTLSGQFHRFNTFTIEFWQNRYTREPGEFFKIASQFYLHGYADQSGVEFSEWHILDVVRVIGWLKDCGIDTLATRVKPSGPSRAAFLPIEYTKIPSQFFLASSSGES